MNETYIVKLPTSGKVETLPFNAENSYSQLHDTIGGCIEAAVIPEIPTKEPYTIDCFVDEEGLLKLLPLNERLTTFVMPFYPNPLVGDAVFVAHDADGETVGLSKADADAIASMFV